MIEMLILLFFSSLLLLYFANKIVIEGLSNLGKILSLREFVVAFFIMAFAASLPNLFLGIISALKGIPELSMGDVIGGNIVDLSLTIGLAGLIAKEEIKASSRMVQGSSLFTFLVAILPILLILDGTLSRTDGIILLLSFIGYSIWLFSKSERYTKIYDENGNNFENKKNLFFEIIKIAVGLFLILFASFCVVKTAQELSVLFSWKIETIGLLIVGLANCLPELSFAIICAKKNETWMILGDLMGSIVVPATLVLGIVAIISPIFVSNFNALIVAGIFLLISATLFYIFTKTEKIITKKESIFLLFIYIFFLIFEILIYF
ncbi:MAG: sodium:calcium antiporter [Minisyncoccia bacterium]